jgi:hypothetical protein
MIESSDGVWGTLGLEAVSNPKQWSARRSYSRSCQHELVAEERAGGLGEFADDSYGEVVEPRGAAWAKG